MVFHLNLSTGLFRSYCENPEMLNYRTRGFYSTSYQFDAITQGTDIGTQKPPIIERNIPKNSLRLVFLQRICEKQVLVLALNTLKTSVKISQLCVRNGLAFLDG